MPNVKVYFEPDIEDTFESNDELEALYCNYFEQNTELISSLMLSLL